jgi:malate dehydrogenase (oxaloacetate-decarboxylating)
MPLSRYYNVRCDPGGRPYIAPLVRGNLLLSLPLLNKDTAFNLEGWALLGLEGLLPPRVTMLQAFS